MFVVTSGPEKKNVNSGNLSRARGRRWQEEISSVSGCSIGVDEPVEMP